jgi:glyoxylase-like metal-dependent hydrolase (beta-lactamase superfamily II)
MLTIEIKALGAWQANCYLISNEITNKAILIDPGDQADSILDWVKHVQVSYILLTHGDHDHVGALGPVRVALQVPVGIHPADADHFGIQAELNLQEGDVIDFDGDRLAVFHIPGHTAGSIAFQLIEGGEINRAIVGDAIFPGGPGHTKSPADLAISLKSLARTVFTWPDNITLYPGHGGPTTIGAERAAFQAFTAKPLPPDLCGDVTWR